jgi:hypothetical protein
MGAALLPPGFCGSITSGTGKIGFSVSCMRSTRLSMGGACLDETGIIADAFADERRFEKFGVGSAWAVVVAVSRRYRSSSSGSFLFRRVDLVADLWYG